MEVHFRALESDPEALKARPGAMKAQPDTMVDYPRAMEQWRPVCLTQFLTITFRVQLYQETVTLYQQVC
jgi:hypothetical protein